LQVNGILKFAPQYKLIKNYAKSLNFVTLLSLINFRSLFYFNLAKR